MLPIWKDIPTANERIYRVTPDGATAMIGRTLSEEGAAALRARFLVSNPRTPQEMLTAALGTTTPVDLGRGRHGDHSGPDRWAAARRRVCGRRIGIGKIMTLEDIKAAVDAGQTVHWANTGYVVHNDRLGQYLITYVPNGSCIGLTDRSGQRLNGEEAEFFISGPECGDEKSQDGQQRPDGQGRGVVHGGEVAQSLRRQR